MSEQYIFDWECACGGRNTSWHERAQIYRCGFCDTDYVLGDLTITGKWANEAERTNHHEARRVELTKKLHSRYYDTNKSVSSIGVIYSSHSRAGY